MYLRNVIAVMLVLGGIRGAAAEVRYRVRNIPRLSISTEYTEPKDINESGVVVGLDDRGTSQVFAYQWNPQTNQILDLGSLPTCDAFGSHVEAVNDLGHAAGTDAGQGCAGEAWLWTPEAGMVGIGDLPEGNFYSEARDINNLDQIVGRSVADGYQTRAFLWTPGEGMLSLGTLDGSNYSEAYGINDSSWIVGYSAGEAFLWRPNAGMMALGGPDGIAGPHVYGQANAINELGQVAGAYYGPGGLQPFLWDAEHGVIGAGRLQPEYTEGWGSALGINNHGQIVGFEDVNRPDGYSDVPIIWDERRGLRDLSTLLNPCFSANGGDVYFLRATAINENGWIAVERVGRGAVLIPYIPGDLDTNERVDLFDLGALLAHFGLASDAAYANGDLDCDADVDLQDLAILLGNFGETLP